MSNVTPTVVPAPKIPAESDQRDPILIKEVRVTVSSTTASFWHKILLIVGDTIKRKSFRFSVGLDQFSWELKPPCEIPPDRTVKIIWEAKICSDESVRILLSYADIIERMRRGEPELENGNKVAKVTVVFQDKATNFNLGDVREALKIAERRKSILGRLGRSKELVRELLRAGEALGALHPAAGIVASCLTTIFEFLEEEDAANTEILDLITDMSNIVDYTIDVGRVASISQLKMDIEDMKTLMEETVKLINQRNNQTNPVLSLLVNNQKEIGDLKGKFAKFKERINFGAQVQVLNTVEELGIHLKVFALTRENDEELKKLDPNYGIKDALRCMDGTRKSIISEIMQWTNDFNAPNILWVCGYPGVGKSTIMMTVANELGRSHRLGTIFTFNAQDRTNLSTLWRFFSYALAREFPICRRTIISNLSGQLNLGNATANEIFDHLVNQPLQELATSPPSDKRYRPPVFIIDGLDECGGTEGLHSPDRRSVMRQIAAWAKLHSSLKLIIASRVQDDIQTLFVGHNLSPGIPHRPLSIAMGNTVSCESASDIRLYFEVQLADVVTGLQDETVTKLTECAAGIFSWAVTAVGYIIDDLDPNQGLLDIISGKLPAGSLYALYNQVMTKLYSSRRTDQHWMINRGVAALAIPRVSLEISDLESALNMKHETVQNICRGLRPVLQGGSLRFLHQSFVDFLSSDSCPEQCRIRSDEQLPLIKLLHDFYRKKYEGGRFDDIHNVIATQQDILDLTPSLDTSRPPLLDFLGCTLLKRYQRLGDVDDIQQAVASFKDAMDLTAVGYPGILQYCYHYTMACRIRFGRFGHLDDIEEAVSQLGKLAPGNNEDDMALCVREHGIALLARFEQLGVLSDLENAIATLKKANELFSQDNAEKSQFLKHLGDAYSARFDRLGNIGDLENAIASYHQANQLTSEDLCLTSLGLAYRSRFLRLGDLKDLENAITSFHLANVLTPEDHPSKPATLNNLGNAYRTRFEHLDDIRGLENAIALLRKANELTPEDHPDKPTQWNNLGLAQEARYSYLGDLEDLENAIKSLRQANELTPEDHTNKPALMNNLGNAYQSHFERLGDINDLENAITLYRRANELTPEDHPSKPLWLANLGITYQSRFQSCVGDIGDLENAVTFLRQANELLPTGHPLKPSRLGNLGRALYTRFQHLGNSKDLDETIVLTRQAIELTPKGHSKMRLWLWNLGFSLQTRFELQRDIKDIEEAIPMFRQADDLTPNDDPKKLEYSQDLQKALRIHAEHFSSSSAPEAVLDN